MSSEKFTTPTTTDNSLFPSIKWYGNSNFCSVFKGSCLKLKNAAYTSRNRIFFQISYELDTWSRDVNSDFTLEDCLFGGVDKKIYSGYDIEFDIAFDLSDGSVSKNVIIFGVKMSSAVHIHNKKKDILILGLSPRQGLDDATLSAES